jgi:hypothetical protein
MRLLVLLASTSMLAACSGGGAQSVTSAPPPVTGGGTTGGGTTGGTANTTHTFADPKAAKTYKGVGGQHVFEYLTDDRPLVGQQAQKYAGNTTTPRSSTITIAYDPADAVYSLTVTDGLTGAANNTRFQDPASRTDFGGTIEPQWGTPQLMNSNVSYLQAGDGTPRSPYGFSGTGVVNPGDNDTPPSGAPGSSYQSSTLFLLKPGTETKYVTYAGYLRNSISWAEVALPEEARVMDQTIWHLERGAFAFGEATPNDAVPTTGSGSFTGSLLATMVFNPTLDGQDVSGQNDLPTYFQWIEGTANLAVNFAASSFNLSLNGTVLAPQIDQYSPIMESVVPEGSTFAATGKGDINMINFGGFKGFIESARFTNPGGSRDVAIEGSTIDGTFYGPGAQEAGGGFRIVGGNPDERVDILGAFVGKR